MNTINDITINISNMYQFFNKELDAKLPDDVVFALIPNQGRSHYLGWFARSRWVRGEEKLHEINIASDKLNRTVDEIAETLIHEMVHLCNFLADIKDCNRQQYHNKKFKSRAESFGLNVERVKNKGYAHTSLGDKAQAMVDKYQTEILNGANPFIIHRVTELKDIGMGSDKRMVAINGNVADNIIQITGGKLSKSVNGILIDWLKNKETA